VSFLFFFKFLLPNLPILKPDFLFRYLFVDHSDFLYSNG
jgi:hypothetical protein